MEELHGTPALAALPQICAVKLAATANGTTTSGLRSGPCHDCMTRKGGRNFFKIVFGWNPATGQVGDPGAACEAANHKVKTKPPQCCSRHLPPSLSPSEK